MFVGCYVEDVSLYHENVLSKHMVQGPLGRSWHSHVCYLSIVTAPYPENYLREVVMMMEQVYSIRGSSHNISRPEGVFLSPPVQPGPRLIDVKSESCSHGALKEPQWKRRTDRVILCSISPQLCRVISSLQRHS